MYFISHKSDGAYTMAIFLSDLRVEGFPSEVIIIRSDDGGELGVGKFGKLCRVRSIKQEFTTADIPEYYGVAERELALIESATLVARIHSSELFSGFSIPDRPSSWAEAMNWACGAYTGTATVGNSENRSPYEMFYGEPSRTNPIPVLKSGFCKYKRMYKMGPKARRSIYLNRVRNDPSESKQRPCSIKERYCIKKYYLGPYVLRTACDRRVEALGKRGA